MWLWRFWSILTVNFRPKGTYYISNRKEFCHDFREPIRFDVAALGAEIFRFEADRSFSYKLCNCLSNYGYVESKFPRNINSRLVYLSTNFFPSVASEVEDPHSSLVPKKASLGGDGLNLLQLLQGDLAIFL